MRFISLIRVITLICIVIFYFSSVSSAQKLERYKFDIKAQPVNNALIELALQRGLNVVYLANLTKDIKANEVKGDHSLAQALDLLLDGSGLKATITNNRMIKIKRVRIKKRPTVKPRIVTKPTKPKAEVKSIPVVSKPAEIERIEVVAQLMSPYNLGSTIASTKTQRDFLETPQIINALPKELSTDINARSYSDTVALASSVTYLERSTGVVDELRLRGFAYPALKINGMSSHAYVAPVDVAFIDNIEVAKGPSSVLFGRMEPGGVINMMLKKPGSSQDNLMVRYADDDFKRAELDINWQLSDSTELRSIGFSQRHGSRDEVDLNDADGLMLALNHQFDNGGELNLHYRFESQEVLQRFGSPVEGFNSSVQFFREDNGDIEVVASRQEDVRSGLDVDRNSLYLGINDWLIADWSADFHLQVDQYKASSLIRYPIISEFVVDINGDIVTNEELTEALLADEELFQLLAEGLQTVSVDPENISFESAEFSYDTQFISTEFTLYKTLSFDWFELEQLYGVNFNRSKPETLVWQTHDTRSNFVPTEQTEVLFNTESTRTDLTDINAGLFGQWVLSWQDFTAFVGTRVDYLKFSSNHDVIDQEKSFTESTFRLGGIYRLTDTSSLFLNYSESFSPQFGLEETEVIDAVEDEDDIIANVIFPEPARSNQYELGIKKSWLAGQLQTSCSAFNIEKRGINTIIKRQKNQGLECDVAGSFGHGWHLALGLHWLDAEITESSEPDFIGKRPRMTPEHSLRLWLNKEFSLSNNWHGSMGLGLTYVDKRFYDSENEEALDGYQVVDAAISFEYGEDIRLSLMLRNIFDEVYTQGVFNALPYWTNPGQERTFETRLSYYF